MLIPPPQRLAVIEILIALTGAAMNTHTHVQFRVVWSALLTSQSALHRAPRSAAKTRTIPSPVEAGLVSNRVRTGKRGRVFGQSG